MEKIEPGTEKELAEVVRKAEGALRIEGGGSRGVVAHVVGDVLSARRLSGISLYEPGALTLVVKAGTPLAEVEALLAEKGQYLPFEPPNMRALLATSGTPTIGGLVAANASGPRRIRAGACRDSLIGVRFVDGRGDVIRSGGRVMKNVTGYDLVKLMAGSHGTLGVLSEVSFKVLPAPEAVANVVLEGLEVAEAVAAMAVALRTPFEVSGAAFLPGEKRVMMRLEGFEASVAYRAGRIAEAVEKFGTARVASDGVQVAEAWKAVRDVLPFAGREGDVWRIHAKPTDAPDVIAAIGAQDYLLDWGGGLIWALTNAGTDLRARLPEGAIATLVRGSGFPRFHPEPVPVAALTAGLRRQFDPRGILNPGLMG